MPCKICSHLKLSPGGVTQGLPVFPSCRGAAVGSVGAPGNLSGCRVLVLRCAGPVRWAALDGEKITGTANSDSVPSARESWLLSLCWHMCYGCRFLPAR